MVHIEADHDYTTLHTAERKYVLVSSLTALEEKLNDPFFLRVHRKFAVDIRRISSIEGSMIRIGEMAIPVGRTHRDAVNRRLRRL